MVYAVVMFIWPSVAVGVEVDHGNWFTEFLGVCFDEWPADEMIAS